MNSNGWFSLYATGQLILYSVLVTLNNENVSLNILYVIVLEIIKVIGINAEISKYLRLHFFIIYFYNRNNTVINIYNIIYFNKIINT